MELVEIGGLPKDQCYLDDLEIDILGIDFNDE
jgi:hypothetical protein